MVVPDSDSPADRVAGARHAALRALGSWPRRRDRLPGERAELVAAAWRTGARNIAGLANVADVSRDTIYGDLQGQGIDVTARGSVPAAAEHAMLRAETAAEISRQSEALLAPTMAQVEPDPLAVAAWQMSAGYDRLAELVGDLPADRVAEVATDLAYRLQAALRQLHIYWAGQQSPEELAAHTHSDQLASLDDQALVADATISLLLPAGQTIAVRLGHDDDWQHGRSWTSLASDSALIDITVDAVGHLELQAALDTIAQVLTRNLADEAFES